jgi:hypothetical protein
VLTRRQDCQRDGLVDRFLSAYIQRMRIAGWVVAAAFVTLVAFQIATVFREGQGLYFCGLVTAMLIVGGFAVWAASKRI